MFLSSVLRPKPLLPRCSKLLPIFPGGRSHFSLNFWDSLDPEVTVHQISAELCPFENLLIFFLLFPVTFTYSLHPVHWIIQESVYVLHLITCHRHIMPTYLRSSCWKYHQIYSAQFRYQDWTCPQIIVKILAPPKYYKSHPQYFPTQTISSLDSDASQLDISTKGKYSIPIKNMETWEKRACRLVAINSDLFSMAAYQCPWNSCSVYQTLYRSVYNISYRITSGSKPFSFCLLKISTGSL